MPIEAIAITNSTATGMSVSCSGVCVGRTMFTTGPNGITEKVTNAGTVAMTGARRKTTLSAAFGMMSSLSASFTPSARLLQQAEGAVHVGADAVLHPGHHAALPPDVEQREQHQDHEDQHGLDEDHPPRVVAEVARASGCRSSASRRSSRAAITGRLPSRVTRLPGEADVGQQAAAGASWPAARPRRRRRSATTGRQGDRAAVTGDGDASGPRASYVAWR